MEPTNDPQGGAPVIPEVIAPENNETPATPTPEPEKVTETDEDRLTRFERQAKQLRKKLGKEEPEKKVKKEKSDDLDYGELAFYNSKSDSVKIETDEEVDFLKTTIEETGKSQKALLASPWFKKELAEQKEARNVARATPTTTRASGENAKTQADYWLKNGGLPENTPENFELRSKIVNMRTERAKGPHQFSSQPIVDQSQH